MPATALKTKQWSPQIQCEIKAVDDAAHTFTGLAAAWSLDLGDDVIQKGAFKRTLDRWEGNKAKRPIYLLNGHNAYDIGSVVGKMTGARETDDGLETDWAFVPDDPAAEAAFKRVKGGFVTAMSIGYTPMEWEMAKQDGKTVRRLKEVKLHEVSLVIFPMNEDARIDTTSVKTLAQWQDMTAEERTAYVSALPQSKKDALRALLEPEVPAPALAPEDLKTEIRKKLRRLTLQQLAPRVSSGPAPVEQTIAHMKDRTHGIDPGEARVA